MIEKEDVILVSVIYPNFDFLSPITLDASSTATMLTNARSYVDDRAALAPM